MIRFKGIRKIKRHCKDIYRFFSQNGQLIFLLVLATLGCIFGTVMYRNISAENQSFFAFIATGSQLPHDFMSACYAVVSSAFIGCILLVIVFLFGMTPFGCPLILLFTALFGFWTGVAQSCMYTEHGVKALILTVLTPAMITETAILFAAKDALRMSCIFSRQLLPSGAHCGSMWQDFKRYVLRFISFLCIIFAAAIIDVLLRSTFQLL